MVDLSEVGLNIVTGGAYAVGKAIHKGFNKITGIVDDVENAAEQAGLALAKIGDTVVTLGDDLDSLIVDDVSPLIEDIDDLFVIERLVARDESDLWDEEKERLSDLIQKKNELKAQIDTLREEIKAERGVEIPDTYGLALQTWIAENANPDWSFWDRLMRGVIPWWVVGGIGIGGSRTIWDRLDETGQYKVSKIRDINSSIIKIDKEIHEILYNEPGVLPTTIYNVKEVIERFNTIEQPKIEDILDSVDDNLVESQEIMEQIKKLFVTKKKVPIDIATLPKFELERLPMLEWEYNLLESVIHKDLEVAKQFMNLKVETQPVSLNLPMAKSMVAGEMRPIEANVSSKTSLDNLTHNPAGNRSEINKNLNTSMKMESRTAMVKDISMLKSDLKGGIGPNVLKASRQPDSLKMATCLINSKYHAYNSGYSLQKAVINKDERDIAKVKHKIDKIKYKVVEEPGVIPRTLANFEDILKRFNTEEQPRIEAILDSANDNLTESKNLINKANTTFEKVSDFTGNHKLLVKMALGVVGGAVVMTLVLIPIALIRLIIFGL